MYKFKSEIKEKIADVLSFKTLVSFCVCMASKYNGRGLRRMLSYIPYCSIKI